MFQLIRANIFNVGELKVEMTEFFSLFTSVKEPVANQNNVNYAQSTLDYSNNNYFLKVNNDKNLFDNGNSIIQPSFSDYLKSSNSYPLNFLNSMQQNCLTMNDIYNIFNLNK